MRKFINIDDIVIYTLYRDSILKKNSMTFDDVRDDISLSSNNFNNGLVYVTSKGSKFVDWSMTISYYNDVILHIVKEYRNDKINEILS